MFRSTTYTILIIILSLCPSSLAFWRCRRKFRKLRKCLNRNAQECDHCRILSFPNNPFSNSFCDTANDALCNAYECCPACADVFEEYESCLGTIWFFGCDFDCAVAPTPEPTAQPTTAAPSVSSSPTTEEQKTRAVMDELENVGCLRKFGDFMKCVVAHPVQCISCFASHLPNLSDAFSGGDEGGFCNEAEESICSFGACCDPCEEEFITFDDCFEDIVEEFTSCAIDCDDYFLEEGGEIIVHPLDPICVDKFSTYTSCLAQNPFECGSCAVLNLDLVLPDNTNICDVAVNSVCGFSQCCSSCVQEFDDFDECFEAWVSLATLGQCDIECDDYDKGGTQ